jgi:rhamnosyltransferase
MAAELLPDADILVYMTQDAILADSSALHNLLRAFDDPQVAAAFGRQLPRPGSGPIEAHSRIFNYPEESSLRSLESRDRLGIKTIFLSNSLSAYRRSALMAVGGFPSHVIFGEDTVTAARLIQAGCKIAYVSDARAYHSHPYTVLQEFRRYFDIGVLHRREAWLLDNFGKASGEGKRFVLSELRHLRNAAPWQIPSALLRTGAKMLGYRLGRQEAHIPLPLKRAFSMHKQYWNIDTSRKNNKRLEPVPRN